MNEPGYLGNSWVGEHDHYGSIAYMIQVLTGNFQDRILLFKLSSKTQDTVSSGCSWIRKRLPNGLKAMVKVLQVLSQSQA